MWEWAKDKFGTTNEYTYTDNTSGYNDLYYQQQQVTASQYQIQQQQQLHQQQQLYLQQMRGSTQTAWTTSMLQSLDPLAEQKDMLQKVHDAAKAYAYERVLCA